MISDGDAKTVQHLNENKPYGEGVMIETHKFVSHVQKRMGTQLRTLKKSGKRDSSGKAMKLEGRGCLTDKVVDQLQVYYGGAIRGHPNDLAGMERAIWAVFFHSISTDAEPQHDYCPSGEGSWCKFQRAQAASQEVSSHTGDSP